MRYDHIIFEAPYGERIVINDMKPGDMKTCVAVNSQRDRWRGLEAVEDPGL